MSLMGLLTRGPPGVTRDVRRIPGVYYSAVAGLGWLQGKHVISRRRVLAYEDLDMGETT
jgi:tartrate dehydratase beta subunit/fumarate hydratase class I family protein